MRTVGRCSSRAAAPMAACEAASTVVGFLGIASGPVAGYGLWVKLRHPDGSVTLYGHIDTTEVEVGQRVMAGDQIATVGNRGNPPAHTCTSK